ncbi:pentapeptide repeat-containing protein [Protofrankia symbiont of Coriaria ruscifolia]|uniref:pentapeptide repeat-containing protein n=1 Tax=Protofrankia symbiont of Coriaria ruscifolia TaxID=1306542 RepID=UPI0013EF80DF|nr:pentapeptide repeat-containing protein [Protofrankia symbiont of Coriaria ruscifolia]
MPVQSGGGRREARRERHAVRLPEELVLFDGDISSETFLDGVLVESPADGRQPTPAEPLVDVELTNSLLRSARLTGRTFRRLHCRNVVFDGCDLSGVILHGSKMNAVEFHRCRLSGMVFGGARLADVLFSNCKMDVVNLRMVEGRFLEFRESDLRELDLYGASITNLRIHDSDVSSADLSTSSLAGDVRLHGSRLRELKGTESLTGAVIGTEQLMDVAMMLFAASGITVDDERH